MIISSPHFSGLRTSDSREESLLQKQMSRRPYRTLQSYDEEPSHQKQWQMSLSLKPKTSALPQMNKQARWEISAQ